MTLERLDRKEQGRQIKHCGKTETRVQRCTFIILIQAFFSLKICFYTHMFSIQNKLSWKIKIAACPLLVPTVTPTPKNKVICSSCSFIL
jgi:hypothetical protein